MINITPVSITPPTICLGQMTKGWYYLKSNPSIIYYVNINGMVCTFSNHMNNDLEIRHLDSLKGDCSRVVRIEDFDLNIIVRK